MAVTVRPSAPQPCLAFASSTAAASTRCIEGARRPIWSCVRFRPPVCVRPCLRTRIYIRPCLRTIHDFDAVCLRGYVRVHVCVVLAAGADGLGACACGVPELLALLARLHTEGRVGDRGRRLVRLFPAPRNHSRRVVCVLPLRHSALQVRRRQAVVHAVPVRPARHVSRRRDRAAPARLLRTLARDRVRPNPVEWV